MTTEPLYRVPEGMPVFSAPAATINGDVSMMPDAQQRATELEHARLLQRAELVVGPRAMFDGCGPGTPIDRRKYSPDVISFALTRRILIQLSGPEVAKRYVPRGATHVITLPPGTGAIASSYDAERNALIGNTFLARCAIVHHMIVSPRDFAQPADPGEPGTDQPEWRHGMWYPPRPGRPPRPAIDGAEVLAELERKGWARPVTKRDLAQPPVIYPHLAHPQCEAECASCPRSPRA